MREIKFRLLIADKIVGYEKWYCGRWSTENKYWVVAPCWLYSEDGKTWTHNYIFHNKKEQFTDLLDKNGKEIYEGDLIKIDGQIWPVIWGGHWEHAGFGYGGPRPERFVWESAFCWDSLNAKYAKDCEVIGNIHENLELIEKGAE